MLPIEVDYHPSCIPENSRRCHPTQPARRCLSHSSQQDQTSNLNEKENLVRRPFHLLDVETDIIVFPQFVEILETRY